MNCSRQWLVAALVFQNSLGALVGKITRTKTSSDDLYLLVSELFKFILSLLLEMYSCGSFPALLRRINVSIIQKPFLAVKDTLVLAMLYFISNALQYVALTELSAPVFQVLIQTKLVTTAIMSVLVLKRSYSTKQWISLFVLSFGVAIVVSEEGGTKVSEQQRSNTLRGIVAVAIVCVISSLAGVYFEKVLKHDQERSSNSQSLWLRNMTLSFFSMLIASLQVFHDQFSLGEGLHAFFRGFTALVWLQVLLFSCGGILVAAVIKYADNVIKGLATGISVVLTSILSALFLGTALTIPISTGAGMIITAIMNFFGSCPNFYTYFLLEEKCNMKSRVSTTLCRLGFICLAFLGLNHLKEPLITTSKDTPKEAPFTINASTIMNDLVRLSSSKESLDTLRSVQSVVKERSFHEATYILYDIRTKLGRSPAKYLEIGTYTGISSSLMLRHPFPTDITAVDPCILPKTHFMGSLSQEETIRKNIALVSKTKRSQWNLTVGYSPQALPKEEKFDIIFIDGDHSTKGVWSDYNHTLNLLRPGGFMVFDDYLDSKFSPDVKPAVDDIAQITDLIPIGTPPDIHGIHADLNLTSINEYIFYKPENFNTSFRL